VTHITAAIRLFGYGSEFDRSAVDGARNFKRLAGAALISFARGGAFKALKHPAMNRVADSFR
jgi:hypothetical protein